MRALAAVVVTGCALFLAALASSATGPGGWWWTQGHADEVVAQKVTIVIGHRLAYWDVGCAGIGRRAYFDVQVVHGPTPSYLERPSLTRKVWHWRRFRCVLHDPQTDEWKVIDVHATGPWGLNVSRPTGKEL